MANNISWGSYWSVLVFLTVIYYAYVLLVYYRSELRKLLAGGTSVLPARNSQRPPPLTDQPKHDENGGDHLFPMVQSLTDEMSAYMEQTGHGLREEIIFGLQRIFKKHNSILNTSYQEAIESLLIAECENKCAIRLNDEEVKQVWMG